MKLRFLIPVLSASILLVGCSGFNSQTIIPKKRVTYEDAASSQFIPTNYAATDNLIKQLKLNAPINGTLIISTLVNIDALQSSSTLGRLVSEQISARFTQKGYRAVELKFRDSVYMSPEQGELMLTREVHELAKAHSAHAVVVGSYAQSRDFIYVNLKVIQPNTNTVLAVHDYVLPLDDNNRSMMRRTPVNHFR